MPAVMTAGIPCFGILMKLVMPGLVPGIHVLTAPLQEKTWMAGTKPGHDEERD